MAHGAERYGAELPIGFVFLHGAGLNGSIWRQVAAGMDGPSLLAEFPPPARKKGDAGAAASRQGLALREYVAQLKQQVDAWEVKRVVIVAHSLSGVLGLKLAEALGERVVGFAAVSAAIPRQGGSFLSIYPFAKRLLLSALLRFFGTMPPGAVIRKELCNDLSEQQTAEIVRAYVEESVRVFTDRSDAPPLRVPKLYVQLTEDKSLSLGLQQRMTANLDPEEVEMLNSGHLPMLSQPEQLCQVLRRFRERIVNGVFQ